MLALKAVEASYDTSRVLFGVDLEVHAGEAVALLGRNGMGKTTTLRAIMGILPARAGEIRFEGRLLSGLPSYEIARAGLGLVPEGRQIFPNLSVAENLLVAAPRGARASSTWTLERVFELFPRLRERRDNMGNQLSGGEQQMLAIGRALMTNPKLLILDEATEGLAPMIRKEIWRVLRHLKSLHQSILVVDKHVDVLTRIADRHYILEKGRIAWHGTSAELMHNRDVQSQYLGV
jgi:branched-chain amino acid transport system ATP-binding protein